MHTPRLSFFMALALTAFISCSDADEPTSTNGQLSIEFDARAGTQNLQMSTTYTNALDQEFAVNTLKYYISNIKLIQEDGTYYTDPLSEDGETGYYLIDDTDAASTIITLTGVTPGAYTGMEFTVGVDANRVSAGAQTGALDPANNMFWSWNAGYIFVRFEGTAPVSTEDDHVIVYHIGGYKSDPDNANLADNIKTKTITFGGDIAQVSTTTEPQVHIMVDVLKFFEGTTDIDFSASGQCHAPACGVAMANNYADTFVFDHIHE